MGTPAVSLPLSTLDTPAGALPFTVWPCAPTSRGRHLGRHAILVEYESRWAQLVRANLTHAAAYGPPCDERVLQGDAGRLISLLDLGVMGQVALVLTSPAARRCTARPRPKPVGVARWHDSYGSDPANLVHASLPALLAAMGRLSPAVRRYCALAGSSC